MLFDPGPASLLLLIALKSPRKVLSLFPSFYPFVFLYSSADLLACTLCQAREETQSVLPLPGNRCSLPFLSPPPPFPHAPLPSSSSISTSFSPLEHLWSLTSQREQGTCDTKFEIYQKLSVQSDGTCIHSSEEKRPDGEDVYIKKTKEEEEWKKKDTRGQMQVGMDDLRLLAASLED